MRDSAYKEFADGTAEVDTGMGFRIDFPGNGNEYYLMKPGAPVTSHYMTSNIPPERSKENNEHWDWMYQKLHLRSIADSQKNWERAKTRIGTLDTLHNLAVLSGKPLNIAFLSAGPGAETAAFGFLPSEDIGSVVGVDFSLNAANSANSYITDAGLDNQKFYVTNQSNNDYLVGLEPGSLDAVIMHGGVGENASDLETLLITAELVAKSLRDGGLAWVVALVQNRLKKSHFMSDRDQYNPKVAIDILGEFPHAPMAFINLLSDQPGMSILQMTTEIKSDKHALEKDGPQVDHSHMSNRGWLGRGSGQFPKLAPSATEPVRGMGMGKFNDAMRKRAARMIARATRKVY